MDELLVYGYCRQIDNLLMNQLIPSSITELCLLFFKSTHFMYCISRITILQIDIIDIDTKKVFSSQLHLDVMERIDPDGSGKCICPQIRIPTTISKQYFHKNTEMNCSALFICGGLRMSDIHAILFDPIQLQQQAPIIDMFDWKLPIFDYNDTPNGSYALFSELHGLILIGGCAAESNEDRKECFKLSFNDDNYFHQNLKQWKWQRMPNMKKERYRPTAALINRNYNEKIIVLGGSYEDYDMGAELEYPKSVEIYDFKTNKWNLLSECNIGKCTMGICYDEKYKKRLYVGGGVCYLNGNVVYSEDVSFYDIIKNKWYDLPSTNVKHKDYPALWMEDGNMLYIASSNGVESLDLRQSYSKWIWVKNHIVSSVGGIKGETWRINH